jgi:hypothetical protein
MQHSRALEFDLTIRYLNELAGAAREYAVLLRRGQHKQGAAILTAWAQVIDHAAFLTEVERDDRAALSGPAQSGELARSEPPPPPPPESDN